MTGRVTRCPDCNATYRKRQMDHNRGCPLMARCDEAADADLAFFRDNPTKTRHDRPATPAEQQMVKLSSGFRPVTVVVQWFPGGVLTHGYVDSNGYVAAMGVVR